MRTPYVKLLLSCLFTLAVAGSASAQNRYFVGTRNLGMGNTGVGASQDALAVHFNPAGMAFNNGWEIQFPLVTADAEVGGDLFDNLDEINELFDDKSLDELQARFDDPDDGATFEDLETMLDAFLYELPEFKVSSNGGNVRAVTGPAFRWKNWGISASVIGNGGIETRIDLENGLSLSSLGVEGIPTVPDACGTDQDCLDLAGKLGTKTGIDPELAETLVAAAGKALEGNEDAQEILEKIALATIGQGLTLADNGSAIVTTTTMAAEIAFSYSHLVFQDKLAVGGNFRVMKGWTRSEAAAVANLDSSRDTFDDALSGLTDRLDTKTSTEVGIDLGVMYRPWEKWSFGLTAENLNTPTFQFEGGFREYKLEPLARAGFAYRPLKWFNIAADLDLNEIDSQVIYGYGYQYANVGTEFLVGRWFSGWLGAYTNLAAERSDANYTGGVGFGIGRLQLSLALAASSGRFTIRGSDDDDLTLPEGVAASFMIAWREKNLPES